MNNTAPICTVYFNNAPGYTHISQVLAGYKMLEDEGKIKIKKAEPCTDFRAKGFYEHNGIVEVHFKDKIIAYDMADGYQSIHRKDVFDSQMDRVDFYFKRSYNPAFHAEMRNKHKVKPLGLNYLCTCKGNPYDKFYLNGKVSLSEIRRFAAHIHIGNKDKFFYKQFESNNKHFEQYNLLFLTRIWDSENINAANMKSIYPYFSDYEAIQEAEKWKDSLDTATKSRIEYVKALRENFGNRVIAGIIKDDFSQKICPELIINSELTERSKYIDTIKNNYICITSEGLHHSIGWKFAEFVAAGKSIITEPLFYEVPFDFCENQNYLVYNDTESLLEKCKYLLGDISAVHQMEEQNRRYYSLHLKPDMLIYDTLKTAKIL